MKYVHLAGAACYVTMILVCWLRDRARDRILKRLLAENDILTADTKRFLIERDAEVAAFIEDPFNPRWDARRHPSVH